MSDKTRIYPVFIVTISILFHCVYCVHAEKTAVVIKSQNLSAYNAVVKGFRDECIRNNISIEAVYDLKGKMNVGHKILRKVKKEKPDIVLAIGVLAATISKEKIKDIPIIFCMVINHGRFQLTGANITGIAAEIAIEEQLKEFRTILGWFKEIGVIYDPSKTGNIVVKAESKVKSIGMNLVKYEVDSPKKVLETMKNLTGRIGALWLLPDSTVVTKKSFAFIISSSLENKIPLLCTSDVFVKAGALAAVFPDYEYIGRQAVHLAGELLEPSAPDSLGMVSPDTLRLSINTDTAEKLGLDLEAVLEEPHVTVYP